jgi:hypothetical protein
MLVSSTPQTPPVPAGWQDLTAWQYQSRSSSAVHLFLLISHNLNPAGEMIIQDISTGCKGITLLEGKTFQISLARGRLHNRLHFGAKNREFASEGYASLNIL